MRTAAMYWCGLLGLFVLTLQSAVGDWRIAVEYVNFTRTGSASSHCDPNGAHSQCDPFFHMCLGDTHNLTCANSHVYNDTRTIHFGAEGSVLFPPQILDTLPTRYVVDVKVMDKDNHQAHLMVHFNQVSFPRHSLLHGVTLPVVMQKNHYKLVLNVVVQCNPPYVGPKCDCLPTLHTLCNATSGAHYCSDGWSGKNCNHPVTPCHINTCLNGGTCAVVGNRSVCHCNAGFSGSHCQNNYDDCRNVTCHNGGHCYDDVNGFTCVCPPGVTGQLCETVLNGSSLVCQNGGVKEDGAASCHCPSGFLGSECQLVADGCLLHPCHNSGACVQTSVGFRCQCFFGFSGPACEHDDSQHCQPDPCANGGTCHSVLGVEYCHCAPGFKDPHCATPADECESAPCQNGGTCEDGVNSFICHCPPDFGGALCDMPEPLVG